VQWLRGRCSSNIRPSWKIRTIAPKVAAIDSRLLSTAFRTTARAKCQGLAPSVDVVVSMDGARAQRKLSAGIRLEGGDLEPLILFSAWLGRQDHRLRDASLDYAT
jgi:hypothetical protein